MSLGEPLERRKHTRFSLRLPVHFEYQDQEGVVYGEKGFTRDISLQGVYVYAESPPPTDAEINLVVYFTSLLEADKNVKWSVRARVIRLESTSINERFGGFSSVTENFTLFNGEAHDP